jgi:signal peptidase I
VSEEVQAGVKSPRKARKAAAAEQAQTQTLGQWFKEITILGVVAVGTAVLLTTYLVQAFFIPSASMESTLTKDDRVLVNKIVYKFGEPKPGDIIVFVSPEGEKAAPPANTPYARFMDRVAIAIGLKSSEQDLIKRVIATGGQTIEAKVGLVIVDGRQLVEPYRKSTDPISDIPAQKVPEGHVFVLGDNRADSRDSRVFGPIPDTSIIGKAFARIWPLERLSWLKL